MELDHQGLNKFGVYVALWKTALYDFMTDDIRMHECASLADTVGHRLLYKMKLCDQQAHLEFVLNNPPANNRKFDVYKYGLPGEQELPISIPTVFKEQSALITPLSDKKVTPYVFSGTPKVYLEALINHFELRIKPYHVFGSSFDADADGVMLTGNGVAVYGEGIVTKIEAELKGHTSVFVSGVAEGDLKMVDYVLDRGGLALIHQYAFPLISRTSGWSYQKEIRTKSAGPHSTCPLARCQMVGLSLQTTRRLNPITNYKSTDTQLKCTASLYRAVFVIQPDST